MYSIADVIMEWDHQLCLLSREEVGRVLQASVSTACLLMLEPSGEDTNLACLVANILVGMVPNFSFSIKQVIMLCM